jgi:hypothetical protein
LQEVWDVRLKTGLTLAGLLVVTVACAGPPELAAIPAQPPATAPTAITTAPTATAPPTAGSTTEAMPAPEPTATTVAAPATAITEPTTTVAPDPADDHYGVDAEGYFVRGLASAPVIIEDYSDFL